MKTNIGDPSIERYLKEGFVPTVLVDYTTQWGSRRLEIVATLGRNDGQTRHVERIHETCIGVTIYISDEDGTAHLPFNNDIHIKDASETRLDQIETKLKAGRAIERKMAKMRETEGDVTSVGQWVNRFARAIGADMVMLREFQKGKIRYDTAAGAVGTVNYELELIRKDHVERKAGKKA